MSFSLTYLAHRLAYRVWHFVYDWYVGGARVIGGRVIGILEAMDRGWAFRITLKNLFKPMYGDHSFIGGVLGFFFRCGRLIISGSLYAVVILIGVCVYAAWALIPIYVATKGFIR